ncbi:uncharacterized protein LOC144452721 [Glandiceps talaboti]
MGVHIPGCVAVANCEEVRCSSSVNQYCFKCDYDRGGIKQAYEAIDVVSIQQRECEQRCSWREDSKFCYPGTCPGLPSTCQCVSGFSGDNCLTITDKPTVEQCNGQITQTQNDVICHIDCTDGGTNYCEVDGDKAEFEWRVTYTPDFGSIGRPYYVNESAYGIVATVLQWELTRDGTILQQGTENCLSEESYILNIPQADLPTRSCLHTISIAHSLLTSDRITFKLRSRNGGYVKINNYDVENIVTVNEPNLYEEETREDVFTVAFDFLPPQHCTANQHVCSGSLLDIGASYRRDGVITLSWVPDDWQDSPSGIHHYDFEAFLLTTDDTNDLLGMRARAPHAAQRNIDPQTSETVINLPETGVFAIVFTVFDTVGNAAKSRRFLTFDPDSTIEIDSTKPIAASEAVYNAGIFWLTIAEGDLHVSWDGHFYNAFYRDGNLLNGIEEYDPPLGQYDEAIGQPPSSRSREAIPNADGVTMFQIDFAESSSGRTDAKNWVDVDKAETSHKISISADNNQYVTVWLRAFDVIGNKKEDMTSFYIDKTLPTLSEMKVIDVDKSDQRTKRAATAGSGVLVQAHDDESGILEIRWELYDKKDTTVKYGEGKMDETSPNGNTNADCTALTCTCLTYADVCFYLEFVVPIDTSNLVNFPKGRVECIARVIVVNNAGLEITDTIEITLTSAGNSAAASTGSNVGVSAGVSVVVILLVVVGVGVLFLVLYRRGTLANCRKKKEETPPLSKAWSDVAKGNKEPGVNAGYERDVEAAKKENNTYARQPARPPKVQNKNVLNETTDGDGAALARAEMEFPSTNLVLKELLKTGINKAKATNIAGKSGSTLVVVKALKDYTNKTQRDHLMNELDMMLKVIPHENVIRLLGCITQSGSPKPSIIMEFATYGNLSEVLKRSRRVSVVAMETEEDIYEYTDVFDTQNTVSSDQLMQFAMQITSGMEHLAGLKIIHRKLGVRNIFVGDGKVCKIASFSHALTTNRQRVNDKPAGRLPIRWMAPESLKNSEYSFKSDVWTYGIVLWEIVTLGANPYPGMSNKEVSSQIQEGERMEKPPHCTEELYNLMMSCWSIQPKNRPNFNEVAMEMRRITNDEQVMDLSQYDSELYGDVDDL